MRKIDNYHTYSIRKEKEYLIELSVLYSQLLDDLNDIKDLTESNVNEVIDVWHKNHKEALDILNEEHLEDLQRYSKRIILPYIKNPEEKLNQIDTSEVFHNLKTANNVMLNVTTDYIRQKFIEVGVKEKAYGYNSSMVNDLMQEILRTTHDKLELYATQSTISNLKQFIIVAGLEVSLTQYQWHTQRDSKVRPLHAAMDGKWFDLDDPSPEPLGLQPGEDYNCFPADTLINFAYGIKCAFRRWYRGKLTILTTECGTVLKSTLNHPIFTTRGWIAANDIQVGDYVAQIESKSIFGNTNIDYRKTFISDIFDTFYISTTGRNFQPITLSNLNFHGEIIADQKIDVIFTNRILTVNHVTKINHTFKNLNFSISNIALSVFKKCSFSQLFNRIFFSFKRCIGFFGQQASFLRRHIFKSNKISLSSVSQRDSMFSQKEINGIPVDSKVVSQGKNTFTGDILSNTLHGQFRLAADGNVIGFKDINHPICGEFERICNLLNTHAINIKFTKVINKDIIDFAGHVYNLHTNDEIYVAEGIIAHNCRCYMSDFR